MKSNYFCVQETRPWPLTFREVPSCPGSHRYILFVGRTGPDMLSCRAVLQPSYGLLQALFRVKGVGLQYVAALVRPAGWHLPNIESMLSGEEKKLITIVHLTLMFKMRDLLHVFFPKIITITAYSHYWPWLNLRWPTAVLCNEHQGTHCVGAELQSPVRSPGFWCGQVQTPGRLKARE